MKNFGNRLRSQNQKNFINSATSETIYDARQVLSAKRNNRNNNGPVRRENFNDVRSLLLTRQKSLDFTLPKKTVQNNFYNKDRDNYFNPKSKVSLSTNKFSGKNFSDLHTSQGIFSNKFFTTSNQKPKNTNIPNSSISKMNNQMKRPIANFYNDLSSQQPKQRKRESSVSKMKFTINNEKQNIHIDNSKKPGLTTSKFAASNHNNVASTVNSFVSPIQGYRIEVKNLHPQVTVDDVYELFTSLGGELRSCNLVRTGFAEVVYRRLADAEKSIEEFHGRELDGRPMNLKLVTPAMESTKESSNSEIKLKISRIQLNYQPVHNMEVNKDSVVRSIYAKSMDTTKLNKKPFRFSVTL